MKTRELMKTNRAQAGFTLIELMIVIAIIGILAAVAIPNFLRARDQARYASCLDSLSAIKVAEEMYIVDNGAYTDQATLLTPYMVASCTNELGTGQGCEDANGNNLVDLRIKTNCLPGQAWSITLGDSFLVQATANDKNTCHICVGTSGYRPTAFKNCPTYKAGFHADCQDGL